MKVLILTSRTTSNIYLVNYLTQRITVVGKVIEKRPAPESQKEKMEIRRRMLRKYGFIKTFNKLFYNKYRYYFLNRQQDDSIRQLLFPDNMDIDYTANIPTIEVPNINDELCKAFIKERQPDVIAVCGTTVIKPEVFELPAKGTINIHCGITPEYKSADPIFWALYNNEPDKVGVTIHFVDKGVDTGPIIYQQAVGVDKADDLGTLYGKCIKTGAALMSKALEDIERGDVKTIRKEGVSGKAYYHMDLGIWQYFQFRRRFGKLKRRLS